MSYTPTIWVDGGPPSINAANLNNIEAGIGLLDDVVTATTVWATRPLQSGLSPIIADGSTDDSTNLQAQLNYVSASYGGGTVIIPQGKTVKLNAGITIPARVRLHFFGATLDFRSIGAIVAITVNDSRFRPLVGGRMFGPNWTNAGFADGAQTPQNAFPSTASTGIKVTGNDISITGVQVRGFGRGVDIAQSNTYGFHFTDGAIGLCGVCVWADKGDAYGNGFVAANSGERMVFSRVVIFNSQSGFRASAGGMGLYFDACSFDFLNMFGEWRDSHVFLSNCHLESKLILSSSTNWGTVNDYCFHMDGNARGYFTNCQWVVNDGGTPSASIRHLVDSSDGPCNFGIGQLVLKNCGAWFQPSAGSAQQDHSDKVVSAGGGTVGATSTTVYSFFLSRWSRFTVESCGFGPTREWELSPEITVVDLTAGTLTVTHNAVVTAPSYLDVTF